MAPSQRRRSIDSSSSSSSGPSPGTHDHQSRPPEKNVDISRGGHKHDSPPSYTPSTSTTTTTVLQPPGSAMPAVPPSGYRIPLSVPGPPLPGIERTRAAPFTDLDGAPVFIGSAILQDSVHPCKIAPNHIHPCYVPYGGKEVTHQGRYDLLPFVPEHMEFVPTSHGRIPPGRRPVKGGFEQNGTELYHAIGVINGLKVPGKTGTHLGGCHIPWGGQEWKMDDKYEIL